MARTILVIEADTGFAAQLRTAFGARGAETLVTGEGKEGLQLAESARPDAIVLCVELPRMSGYAVCNKLKKSDGLRDIPLVITSSEATPKTFEQHKKLKTRAEDYVIKPCEPADVVDRVGALVDLGSAAPPADRPERDADLDLLEHAFDALSLDDDEPLGGGDEVTVAPLEDLDDEAELEVVDEPLELPADPPAEPADDLDDMFGDLELTSDDPSEGTGSAEAAVDALGDFEPEERFPEEAPQSAPAPTDDDEDDLLDPMAELGLDLADAPASEAASPDDELDLDPSGPRRDDAAMERLEARNASLEEELASLEARLRDRETGGAAGQREVLRLKGELTQRDKEILRLKESLHAKERSTLDAQERENLLEMEVSRLQEAAEDSEERLRGLAGKVDAQSHRIGSLETELEEARAGGGRADALEASLAEAEARVEALEAEKRELAEDRDALENRLVEAYRRLKADEALRERTRKALHVALELLDGSPDALLDEDDGLQRAAENLAALGGESA